MSERYTKRKVREAGSRIALHEELGAKSESVGQIVNYWRSIHREPLQLAFGDIEQAFGIEGRYAVAGRIKKLSTIIDKLQRPETPSDLDTMYDIAGCRIVVPDIAAQDMLCEALSQSANYDSAKSSRRDYVGCPKQSGYRSKHLIFRYDCPQCGHRLAVELQVRTEYQHAWATAVEMYDRVMESRLKFGEMDNPDAIFFKRASLVIEQLEMNGDCDYVAVRDRYPDSSDLNTALTVVSMLEAACNSAMIVGDMPLVGADEYCLIRFDSDIQTIEVKTLAADEAVLDYYKAETGCPESIDVVLVKGASMQQLATLYPNYFGDISQFLSLITKHLPAFA